MSTDLSTGMRSAQVLALREESANPEVLRASRSTGRARRSPGGHRLYPPDAVTVLRVIKATQRLGFSLDEVADLLQAGRHRHGHADAGFASSCNYQDCRDRCPYR